MGQSWARALASFRACSPAVSPLLSKARRFPPRALQLLLPHALASPQKIQFLPWSSDSLPELWPSQSILISTLSGSFPEIPRLLLPRLCFLPRAPYSPHMYTPNSKPPESTPEAPRLLPHALLPLQEHPGSSHRLCFTPSNT